MNITVGNDTVHLDTDEGDILTDVIVIGILQRLDGNGQGIVIGTTEHTGIVTQVGATKHALDQMI